MNKCSVCRGETTPQKMTYTQWYEGKLVAVENVTADVCQNCGEEYFSPETANKIQEAITSSKQAKTMEVPVYSL